MSMEQIGENIMSQEHPVVRGLDKRPHFWLTQHAIACLSIKKLLPQQPHSLLSIPSQEMFGA